MARILLLDDHDDDRSSIASLLTGAGHNVLATPDGDAGLAAFAQQPFDLVLLDLGLPRKGGSRVLVDMVTAFPDVRVLVTARGPETISTRAYLDVAHDHGVVRALPKPFTAAHLERAVDVLLTGTEWVGS